jgi:hypothetical protein
VKEPERLALQVKEPERLALHVREPGRSRYIFTVNRHE